MVPPDGCPLVGREEVAALVEDINAAAVVTVAPTVPTARFAEIVEQGHYGDTVCREPTRVGEHMVVNFNGVLREPAELFVVAVAAATEEGRTVEVVDDGVRSGPSEGADGVEDPLLGVGDVLHIQLLIRLKSGNLSSNLSVLCITGCRFMSAKKNLENSIFLLFYVQYKIKIYLSQGEIKKNLENSDFLLTFAP